MFFVFLLSLFLAFLRFCVLNFWERETDATCANLVAAPRAAKNDSIA